MSAQAAPEGLSVMAAVLVEHAFHMILPVDIDDVNGEWQVECNCDAPPIQGPSYLGAEVAFAAHQAEKSSAAGIGLVAEARARALEEAAAGLRDWYDERMNEERAPDVVLSDYERGREVGITEGILAAALKINPAMEVQLKKAEA